MGALCSPGRPAARLLTHILDQSLCSSPATASALLPSLSQSPPPPPPIYCIPAAISLPHPPLLQLSPRHSLLQLHSHASRIPQAATQSPSTISPPTCPSLRLSVFIKTVTRVFPCSALVASPAVDVLNSSLALRRPLFLSPSPFLARTLLLSTCSV